MRSEPKLRALRKRTGEYYRQKLHEEYDSALTEYAAVTFRPGGYLDSFEGNLIRRAGMAALVTLRYEPHVSRGEIPVEIYGAEIRTDGSVRRSARDLRLSLDLHCRPRPGARGRTIDPQRNPSLLDVAVRLHQQCHVVLQGWRRSQACVIAPPLLLGFAPKSPPAFEDTPALREESARRLGVLVEELGRNGSVLLDRLLREIWESVQTPPDSPENATGNLLVPARFCPSARGYLNTFEDFRDLVGVPTWNPARQVRIQKFENPARRIWQELGYGESPDFDQPFAAETLAEAERRMREALITVSSTFTTEDILDGLTTPELPFIAWSVELPRLRGKVPSWAEPCCTDADLKIAVRQPNDPLWVRHACSVQVVRRETLAQWLGATDWGPHKRTATVSHFLTNQSPADAEPLGIAG